MKIAAQLYTVREYTKTAADFNAALKRVKGIGYSAVQLSGLGADITPAEIKTALNRYGMEACATHTPLKRIVEDTERVIEEHILYGAKYVGLGWHNAENIDGYKQLVQSLAQPIERMAAAGLKFVYHNHAHEFADFDGVKPLYYMLGATDREKFGFLADFYWVHTAGLSYKKFIGDFGGRLKIVHFKDVRALPLHDKRSNMAEVFAGNMDYEGIYSALKADGCEWVAVEQDECDGDPFDSLKLSLDNIVRRGLRFDNL